MVPHRWALMKAHTGNMCRMLCGCCLETHSQADVALWQERMLRLLVLLRSRRWLLSHRSLGLRILRWRRTDMLQLRSRWSHDAVPRMWY